MQNRSGSAKDTTRRNNEEVSPTKGPAPLKPEANPVPEVSKNQNGSSSLLSSTSLLKKIESPVNDWASFSDFSQKGSVSSPEESVVHHVKSSSSSLGFEGKNRESGDGTGFEQKVIAHEKFTNSDRGANILGSTEDSRGAFVDKLSTKVTSSGAKCQVGISPNLGATVEPQANIIYDEKLPRLNKNDQEEPIVNYLHVDLQENEGEKEQEENVREKQNLETEKHLSEHELVCKLTQDVTRKLEASRSDNLLFRRAPGMQESLSTNHNSMHVKSVLLSSERAKSSALLDNSALEEEAEKIDILENTHQDAKDFAATDRNERINYSPESKVEVESRIMMLEEELREAAAIEVGLYSVIPEHGSSTNKVHAPARRISRFYLHACKARTQAKRASAARAAASGLVLVSKACGNDVPRYIRFLLLDIL